MHQWTVPRHWTESVLASRLNLVGLRRVKKSRKGTRRRLDLRKTLFVLPNLITLASVFCGFNAMVLVSSGDATPSDFYRAAVLLIFAILFDLMDGRVARMTRTQSAFGLQLDSLADVVSFGVAPSLLAYQWVLHRHPIAGLLTAFLFVSCGAIRLARFNVLSSTTTGAPVKPGKYIVGLPIPPAAGVLIALVVANRGAGGVLASEEYAVVLFVVMVMLSLLMVSTVNFRSFKDLRLNTPTFLFAGFVLGTTFVVWLQIGPQFVMLWLLGLYVSIGLAETLQSLARRLLVHPRNSAPPAAGAS